MLTTAVIALAGETFGVLVGEHGTLRFHHSAGREILRGDQFEVSLLPLLLLIDQAGNGRIHGGQGCIDRGRSEIRHALQCCVV